MRQPLIPFDVPLEDEDDIKWEYFQHYRDMGPERTKVALTEIEVNGKTRDKGLITRWAKKFQWDFRAHAYDMANLQKAHEEIILKREDDIAAYIERDIDIARDMQEIVNLLVKGMKDGVRDGIPINPQVAAVPRELANRLMSETEYPSTHKTAAQSYGYTANHACGLRITSPSHTATEENPHTTTRGTTTAGETT